MGRSQVRWACVGAKVEESQDEHQEEAFALADLVAVMNAGRIEQYGTPEDVRRSPKTPFVAEFLETGPHHKAPAGSHSTHGHAN